MPAVLDTAERRRVAATLTGPPTTCPDEDCGGELEWRLAARTSDHAPQDGRLRLSEVVPRLYLSCIDCYETLWTIEGDDELAELLEAIAAPVPPVQVVVTGRRGNRRRSVGLVRWASA